MIGWGSATARARVIRVLAVASVVFASSACRGDGTFLGSILDGGGGGSGGRGGGFLMDSGMDSSSACLSCGDGCFDCGVGCVCDEIDAGLDSGVDSLWLSPFPNTGAPGWRDSTEPLCGQFGFEAQLAERAPIGIWSDSHTVFAAMRNDRSVVTDLDAGAIDDQVVLYSNVGLGWLASRRITLGPHAAWEQSPAVTGLAEGPLWLHGATFDVDGEIACTLVTLENGVIRCDAVNQVVTHVFGVSAGRAFAIAGATTLLVFDGAAWAPHPTAIPDTALALWADASTLIVAGRSALYRMTPTGWEREALAFDGVTAMWARSTNDVWLGTEDGEIWQFDGQAWQRISVLGGVSCGLLDGVRGIWGSGNTLFFYGGTTLQRWNGTTLENLGNWACADHGSAVSINNLWGSSENEVFLALRDRRHSDRSCQDIILMHFDGVQFHRM